MINDELYSRVKSYSNDLKSIFKPINESTIINNFYINFLDDLVYRAIFENFFSNLTEENIKDCNLDTSDLKEIKNKYEKIQNDILLSSTDLDELIFTKSYYYSSKREILENYPTLEPIFNEIETAFGLKLIENYINYQKLDYKGENKNYKLILNTLIFENLIKNKHIKQLFNNPEDLNDFIDITEVSEELMKNSMQIRKWEIWKTYSTYTNRTFNNKELKKVAEDLVKNNTVSSIFCSDCTVMWKDGDIKEDKIFDLNYSHYNLKLLNCLPDYVAEGIHQLYSMWLKEEMILKNTHYEFSYIKCFLSPILVTFRNNQIKTLYPQLTIYNTGVLNLTFRIMSPESVDYEINNFIYNEVNSDNLQIKEVKLPYEFVYNTKSSKIDGLEKNKTSIKLGSFEHTFVKVESFDNLLNLTQFLIEIISFSISKEFNNIDFISNYWLCSQSIYLLDYNNQPYCKEEIINNFREYLIQILYRLPFLFDVNFSKELPEDLRGLNHYCLFMMKGMSLWISSKDELDLFKDDVNNENKVYEKQVLVEAINHFNLLVNKLYEVSKNNESYNEIIKLQKDLINFERLFRTEYVSNYGEINQIFEYCYREFQWDILFKLSNNLLDIKKNHQIKERTDNLQYLTIIIAFLTLLTTILVNWVDIYVLIVSICLLFLFLIILIFRKKFIIVSMN